MAVQRFPDIADHGLIGDLQTAALITTDGTVDWFCCPRFDSPAVFAALLDADRGGHFQIAPGQDNWVSRQLYLPSSAVLITRFMTPDGVGEVQDFMPVTTGAVTGRHRLGRVLRATRGTMHFAMDLQPRFGYGRQRHLTEVSDEGAVFRSDDLDLTLHVAEPVLERRGDGVHGTWTLHEGETAGVLLESGGGPARRLEMAERLLGQRRRPVHAVHDPHRTGLLGLLGRPVPEPHRERLGFFQIAKAEQGADGQ